MLLYVLPSTQPTTAKKKFTLDQYGYALPFDPVLPARPSYPRLFLGWLAHMDRTTSDPEITGDVRVKASWSKGWIMPIQKCIGVECNTDGATATYELTRYSYHDYSDAGVPPDCGWWSVWNPEYPERWWEDEYSPPPADYKVILKFDQLGHGVTDDGTFDYVEYTNVVLEIHHLLTGVVVTYQFPDDWLPGTCE